MAGVTPSAKVNRNPVPTGANAAQYARAEDLNPIVDALQGATGGALTPLALTSTSGNNARTLADRADDLTNIKDFLQAGDSAALIAAAAVAVANNTTLIINRRLFCNTAVGTVSCPVRFEGNGAIDTTGGGTVTLTGPLTAANRQIIYGTGVTFQAKVSYVVPQWWGALGNGVADDTVPIQAAIDAAATMGGGTVKFQEGDYHITGTINGRSYVHLVCESGEVPFPGVTGNAGTRFTWAGAINGTMFSFINTRQSEFVGFCLNGASVAGITGLLYDSTDGSAAECLFNRFTIRNCLVGVKWGTTGIAAGVAAQGWFRTFTIWSNMANSWGFVINSGNVGQQCEISHGGIQCGTAAGGGAIDIAACNLLQIRRVFGGGTHAAYFIRAAYPMDLIIEGCSSEMWGPGSLVDWRHNDAYFLYCISPPLGESVVNLGITMIQNQINNPCRVTWPNRITSMGDQWGDCRDSVTEANVGAWGDFTAPAAGSVCVNINGGLDPAGVNPANNEPIKGWRDGPYVHMTHLDPARSWVTPPFAAGNFTAGAPMVWTVAAPDVETYAYTLINRSMTVAFKINNSTINIGGGASGTLNIAIPNGKTAAKGVLTTCRVQAGGFAGVGFVYASAGLGVITIQRGDFANFGADAGGAIVQGTITFEIA